MKSYVFLHEFVFPLKQKHYFCAENQHLSYEKDSPIENLYAWKDKEGRKPLIIRGARQVGKTWLMKAFANEAFEHFVYINFEDNEIFQVL